MIAIIKYNAGNIISVRNSLLSLGCNSVITDDPEVILGADRVIFPGVGEAGSAMKYLREKSLDTVIKSVKRPFLGICLGLQLMCRFSEESNTDCLGIFDARVKKFPPTGIVPHMGWNNFKTVGGKLLKGINAADDMYYVHTYYAEISNDTIATCNYLAGFSAAMSRDNFHATQFHPEKSAGAGRQVLKNFIEL